MQMCSVSVAADVCQRAVVCGDRGGLVFACGEMQAEVEGHREGVTPFSVLRQGRGLALEARRPFAELSECQRAGLGRMGI